ncbi:MAG: hypothetical protein WC438_00535 [Candidatus Pacearchaeota archaeon]
MSTTLTQRAMNLDEVKRVVAEALSEDVENLNANTRIESIVGSEQILILDLLCKLGIPYEEYIQDGQMTETGISKLREVYRYILEEDNYDTDDCVRMGILSNSRTAKEFLGKLTIQHLQYIQNHKTRESKA